MKTIVQHGQLFRVVSGTLFLACLVSAMNLAFEMIGDLQVALRSKVWPSVTGRIVRCDVESGWTRTASGSRTRDWNAGVEYEYQVEGACLAGNQVTVANSMAEAKYLTLKTRYRVGSATKVHYDPKRPQLSVLEPGVKAVHLVGLLVPGLLLGFSLIAGSEFRDTFRERFCERPAS